MSRFAPMKSVSATSPQAPEQVQGNGEPLKAPSKTKSSQHRRYTFLPGTGRKVYRRNLRPGEQRPNCTHHFRRPGGRRFLCGTKFRTRALRIQRTRSNRNACARKKSIRNSFRYFLLFAFREFAPLKVVLVSCP